MSSAHQTVGTRQRRAPLRGALRDKTFFPFLAPGALNGRSEEAGLRHDKKLLYVLMNLQHWVSAAADAMVKSYEREKTRAHRCSGGCDALELESRPYVLGRWKQH